MKPALAARQVQVLASRTAAAPPFLRRPHTAANPASHPPSTAIAPRRLFSTSPRPRQTEVVLNPRKDDDGNDLTLEITPRAANVRTTTTTQ